MISINITGAAQVHEYFEKSAQRTRLYTRDATIQSLKLVEASVASRLFPAREQNVQDGRQYRSVASRKPYQVRIESDGQSGEVGVKAHLTKVRSAALISVMRRLGLGKQIERKGLYIDPGSWTKGPNGKFTGRRKQRYTASTNKILILFRFSQHPDLLRWAQRRDKGYQFLRHSVRVKTDALKILTATPSLRENESKIKAAYTSAVTRAFLGG